MQVAGAGQQQHKYVAATRTPWRWSAGSNLVSPRLWPVLDFERCRPIPSHRSPGNRNHFGQLLLLFTHRFLLAVDIHCTMDDPGPSAAYIRSFPATADGPIRPLDSSEPLLPPDADPMVEGQTESLYALLNLPSSASDAEIRERYRSLATTFHPDRQRSDDARRAAHSRFTEIQRAYEVLTDPTKRTVYDLFGEEGLRTSWEVGPRNRTPEEMRAHFQRQAYEKKQLDAEALVKPKGDMSVVLDARAVFFNNASHMSHTPIARLGRVRPGQILMKHSFETPLNKTTQVVWTGQMVARSGAGGGNVVGTVKHQFSSKCWGEVGTSFLAPRIITGKGTYTIDEHT
jgi:DnaJ family protein C protein 11